MPRSRSRSRSPGPYKRERRRSRSRERHRHKKRSRSRSPRRRRRSKSVSPRRSFYRHRSYSPRRSRSKDRDGDNPAAAAPFIDESKLEGLDEEQVDMMKLMGFATFDSSKGKKVDGNDVSAVNIQRKRRYRQYMNRKGGFNRPLDFIA